MTIRWCALAALFSAFTLTPQEILQRHKQLENDQKALNMTKILFDDVINLFVRKLFLWRPSRDSFTFKFESERRRRKLSPTEIPFFRCKPRSSHSRSIRDCKVVRKYCISLELLLSFYILLTSSSPVMTNSEQGDAPTKRSVLWLKAGWRVDVGEYADNETMWE